MLNDKTITLSRGAGCPCGLNPGPVCNQASATGLYDCTACSCNVPGKLSVVSNLVCTHIVEVQVAKTVTPACAQPDSDVLYTIAVRNRSSVFIQDVTVTDPDAVRYLDVGAIRVNGVEVSGDLVNGVNLPEIGPGGTAVMTFYARPVSGGPAVIENTAYVRYGFLTDCGGESATAVSNTATLTVLQPELIITKSADRCCLTTEDPILTYTLVARNLGNTELYDVTVTDQLPERLEYVTGSTRVNGGAPMDLNPAEGVNVGSILAGGQATVSFQAGLYGAAEA